MYYILNETNQLIAADEEMLSLCGVAHIDDLSSKIAKDEISLHLSGEGNMILKTDEDEKTLPVTETSLSSLLGYLHLIHISIDEVKNDDVSISTPSLEDDDDTELIDSIIHDEEAESLDIKEEVVAPLLSEEKEEEITFGDHLNLDDGILKVKNAEPLEDEQTEVPEINVNIDEISHKIGVSSEDYQNFLDEFIDTALGLEKDLQSTNKEKRTEATTTLSHLAEVLHLPVIADIVSDIDGADETNQRHSIESFYGTLSRITITQGTEKTAPVHDETQVIEEDLELFDEPDNTEELITQEKIIPRKTSSGPSFGTISLEGIAPKHFDFQLEEAANDLSLPVELIEEFVHDFIDQAHLETKKMLQAYEDGDLDTIQKIGHLLKGASSNLRINPLSETLYKIQFCEDQSQLEMLIKDYWAHFLFFENQINVISK